MGKLVKAGQTVAQGKNSRLVRVSEDSERKIGELNTGAITQTRQQTAEQKPARGTGRANSYVQGGSKYQNMEAQRADRTAGPSESEKRLARADRIVKQAEARSPRARSVTSVKSETINDRGAAQRARNGYELGEVRVADPTARDEAYRAAVKEAYGADKLPKANGLELAWDSLMGGLTQAGSQVLDTVDFVAGQFFPKGEKQGADDIKYWEKWYTKPKGEEWDHSGNILDEAQAQADANAEEWEKRRALQSAAIGTTKLGLTADQLSRVGTEVAAAVPQAVLAMMSAGASTGATAGSLAAKSGVEMASGADKLVRMATNGIVDMAKDPNFWGSFVQTVGSDYQEALESGADQNQAAMAALIGSFINAAVEIGGETGDAGLQTLAKQGDQAGIIEWVKSSLSEGKEEVIQGIVSRLTNTAVFAKDTPMFGEGGVVDPAAALEEFRGGVTVGAILGGGQMALNSAINWIDGADTERSISRVKDTLGTEGQQTFDRMRTEGQDPTAAVEYTERFVDAYNKGRRNEALTETRQRAEARAAQQIDAEADTETRAAWNAGRMDAITQEAERNRANRETAKRGAGLIRSEYTEQALDSRTADALDKSARQLGVTVEFAEEGTVGGGHANAEIVGNQITIEKWNKNPVRALFGHEITHRIQDLSPDSYAEYKAIVRDAMGAEAYDAAVHEIEVSAREAGMELTEEKIADEVAADYAGRLLENEGVLEEFIQSAQSKPTVVQRIAQVFRELVQKLTGKQKTQAERALDKLEKAYRSAAWATEKSPANLPRNSLKTQENYDYSKSFAEQLKDYENGKIPKNDTLLVGKTPEVFQKIGMTDLPVTINQQHIEYALHGTKDFDHALGAEGLRQLPKALESPVAILSSKTKNGSSLVAMLEIRQNGKQVVVPVTIDGYGTLNWLRIDSNAITSVYGKDFSISKVLKNALEDETKGKPFSVYYVNKEKAARLFEGARVLMPKMPQSSPDGFVHSIREAGSPVNPKLENVTQSQQFKRWFGDWQKHPETASKVVSEDGTPKVVYHQTENEFTIFDTRREGAGTRDEQTPFGIFLKSSSRDIGLRGKNQMALYANIRNPLVAQDRASLSKQLRDISPEYDALIKKHTALDAEYKQKFENAKNEFVQFLTDWRKEHPGESSRSLYGTPEFERVYAIEDNVVDEWTAKADKLSLQAKEVLTNALKDAGYDGIFLSKDEGSWGRETDAYIALDPDQVKSATDNIGTFDSGNADIRFSLKKYTDAEEKQHAKDAVAYFGTTYKWSETGYITADGRKLDFSGRHEGGPGGYRTVDHRDIRDALGDDYGGEDYSGSMVQFMSEGNIRISPESGGINLSVMPTKAQLDTLSDFISKQRGEVILDIDTADGSTVSSTEYPKGTHASKVLNDIKAYFEDGSTPRVSELAQFRYSLKQTKEDNQGHKLTEAQLEFFQDSKVVDRDGQLKVMYQGGNSDFTVFDRKKSSYANLYGRGFYFTDSEAHARQYGSARKFYLNITHPVSTTEATITRSQMRKFLKAVAANEDDFSFENYGYGATVDSVLKSVYGKSDFAMLYDVNQTAIGDMVAAVELFNKVNGTDYDGLILDTETVAFHSDQIKNTDNQNPTNDPDIRYSLKKDDDAPVRQEITSAKTSIKQIPALFKDKNAVFGKTNIDIGGGRFDLAKNYLAERGVESMIFDPYNRSAKENRETLAFLQSGNRADTATCANVLNVIAEPGARSNVILETAKAIKPNGTAYFMVYEGDRSGNGKQTSSGWQNNRKTADYVDEIGEWFNDVQRKGKMIIAKDPVQSLPKAAWEVQPGDAVRYSLKRPAELENAYAEIQTRVDSGEITAEEAIREKTAAVDRIYAEYVRKYGAMESGERPAREVSVPKSTMEGTKVSQTIRTVMEAKATPDSVLPKLREATAQGDFNFETYTDEAATADAEKTIRDIGWDKAQRKWFSAMESGKVSKENTALGWTLYNNAVNSGNAELAIDVLNQMVKSQRSAAQALQATRILKQLSPDGQLYQVQRSVEDLQREINQRYRGKDAPKLEVDKELAEKLLNAGTQKERDAAMADIYRDIGRQMPSTFKDKLNAWRYLAMLGNPRTHVRNIVGNAGFMPVVFAKNAVGTGIEAAASKVAPRMGRTKGVPTGKLLKAAWSDYANIKDAAMGGGKYSDFAAANQYVEEGRQIFGNKALETLRKKNGEALDAEDVWFSQPHYANALAQYCAANKITEEQIRSGDEKVLRKARAYAINEAAKATYRDANALSEAVSSIGGRWKQSENPVKKVTGVLVEGILPFRKTPANILARGLEYSPAGLLKGLSYDLVQVKKGNMTAAQAIDNISAGLTGTGLMMLGGWMAAQGILKGGSSGDDEKDKLDDLAGRQDYALEIGGTSITLDWLAPEALPFFVGANLYQTRVANGGDASLTDYLEAVKNISEPMVEMSCLQSLNDVFDSVSTARYNGKSALMSVLASAATSYITQFFPTILGQAERSTEPERMSTYTTKGNRWMTTDMQYLLGKTSAKVPIWDFQQIPYIDAWGRTESNGSAVERIANNFLNPAYVSTVKQSDTEKEIERLYTATEEGSVVPDRAGKSINLTDGTKYLTAQEYVTYATEKGQKSYAMAEKLINSAGYKAASDDERVDMIRYAYQYANAVAKTKVSDYQLRGWEAKCADVHKKTGLDETVFIQLYLSQVRVESYKDSDGDAISNSAGLQKMALIYNTAGLTDAQRAALFDAFGIGQKIIHYNKAKVQEELEKARKKAQ